MSGVGGYGGRRMAEKLGRVGVWSFALQRLSAADAGEAARQLESQGYPIVWIPESIGSKELFSHAGILLVEQTAVLTADPAEGRRIGRAFAKNYLALPNYANNLRRLGWDETDLGGDGSDRLIDAVIAWGDVDAIATRVRAHLDAGADQVCVQLRAERSADPALAAYGELGAALLEMAG